MSAATSASEPTRYTVEYETDNEYPGTAFEAMYDLLVVPAPDRDQIILERTVEVTPEGQHWDNPNPFGFNRITVRIGEPFTACSIRVVSLVEKHVVNPYDFLPLAPGEEMAVIAASDLAVDHSRFLLQTPFTDLSRSDADALARFTPDSGVWDWLRRLNAHLFKTLSFDGMSTDVTTTARDALGAGGGVCQDFAHIFVGACRAMGIPCRYAAGYLDQGAGFRGDAFLHAWAEAFVPGAGYVGFDPTNGVLVDSAYLKVCHGADYTDCAPIRGVVRTPGAQTTDYRVRVSRERKPL